MSRRTKLIILALFLVLLAIPVAYVALTWSPKAPLQFRFEQMARPSADYPVGDKLAIEIRITNPTPTSITLYRGFLQDPSDPTAEDAGEIIPSDLRKGEVPARLDRPFEIPAYGDVLILGSVHPRLVDVARQGRLDVHYTCESRTKTVVAESLLWVMERSPGWAKDHFQIPEAQQESTPLEVSRKEPHTTAPVQ